MSRTPPPHLPPERTQDLPATIAMLTELERQAAYRLGSIEGRLQSENSKILAAIDRLEVKIDTLAERMESGFRQVDKRFEQVDKRFEQVDKRFEQVDKRFEESDKRTERLETRMDSFVVQMQSMQASFEHQMGALRTSLENRIEDRFQQLQSEVAAVRVQAETQTAQNSAALEGHSILLARIDRVDSEHLARHHEVKAEIQTLAKEIRKIHAKLERR